MKFSVLMSVYKNDKKEYLKEAIDSVITQTVKPSEIVLIEDGKLPTELEEFIKEYERKCPILKVTRLEENVGIGEALKIGLEKCSYDIIAKMDADDISVPNRFEMQLKELEADKNLSVIGGIIEEFIGTKDNVIDKRDVPVEDTEIKEYMKSRCPMNHVATMYRKEDAIKAGGYVEWLFEEDYYLWIRMFLNGCKFKNIKETLVYVRVDENTYQRRGGFQYFKSEARIQNYMLKHKIIKFPRYIYNLIIRFILQVLMPNKLRAFIFKKFARKEVK